MSQKDYFALKKLAFFGLIFRLHFRKISNTLFKLCKWCCSVLPMTIISSIYKNALPGGSPENAIFIILLNEFGDTFRPNGSTFHLNEPSSVENDVKSLDFLCNGT